MARAPARHGPRRATQVLLDPFYVRISIEIGMADIVADEVRFARELVEFGDEVFPIEFRREEDGESVAVGGEAVCRGQLSLVCVVRDDRQAVFHKERGHGSEKAREIGRGDA